MGNSKYTGKQASHGMSHTPEYRTWVRMISRCHNPRHTGYYKYGARGITVCDRWRKSFPLFYEDMGPRPTPLHSIERADNNGNYSPENCRWATPLEQMRNTRHNRYVTFNNETLCVSEWAARLGIGHAALMKRIKLWGVKKALTTPKKSSYDHGEAVRRHFS